MKPNIFEKIIGSVFFTGYIPFASGTFGSLAALMIYLIPGFENPTVMLIGIAIFSVVGVRIGTKFENAYGKDPSQCTIDELVGMWISLLFVPKTLVNIIVVFFVWRLLDVVKPAPARQLEKLNGGLGIMMDDVVSGIYSLITVHILIHFMKLI
ncbi:MAG: phosphatidylglycerophosphatase A [Chlorobi bacterium]|nr:phosphatidylglycerophosphatase A [Chlorobiota bacterium]